MPPVSKYYFASDVHLGLPPDGKAFEREMRFVQWLDKIKIDAKEIFLVGDIFDFWFEYKTVVPRGFVRTLGKIAELVDRGISVHFFAGNHDLWVTDYLQSEIGMSFHAGSYEPVLCGRKFFIAHGDAQNFKDKGHMFLRKVFTSSVLRKMFSSIHPRWGIGLAHLWSHNNRKQKRTPGVFRGEGESLYQFALEKLEASRTDYFIFGHLHAPVNIKIKDATFVILPDWISRTGGYAVFDGDTVEIIYL